MASGGAFFDETARFTRELAAMFQSGATLPQCLASLEADRPRSAFKRIVEELRQSVDRGSSFSSALRQHPQAFDEIYVRLVSVGESSERVGEALTALANHVGSANRLRTQVRRFLSYWLLILPVSLVVFLVLQAFQVVKVQGPSLVVAIAIVAALVLVVRVILERPWGKWVFDAALLRTPIIGPAMNRIAVGYQTQKLGLLVEAGFSMLEALDLVAHQAGNVLVREALLRAWSKVQSGEPISRALQATGLFPSSVLRMISAGEQTGRLASALTTASTVSLDRAQDLMKQSLLFVEPVGLVVLSLAAASVLNLLIH